MAEHIDHQTAEMTNSLSRLGYELLSRISRIENNKSETLSPEEAIIKVLTGHPDPRYIKGLPVIIAKNKVDYSRLMEFVDELKEQDSHLPNKVGYILDLTYSMLKQVGITKDYGQLESTIAELSKIKSSEECVINPSLDTSAYREFAKSRNDERMKRWKIIGLFDEDSFQKTLLLYLDRKENVQ